LFLSLRPEEIGRIHVYVFLDDLKLADIDFQGKSLNTLKEKWGNSLLIEYYDWPLPEIPNQREALELAHIHKNIDTVMKYGYDNILCLDADTRFARNEREGNIINLMDDFEASGDQIWGSCAGRTEPIKEYFKHSNIVPRSDVKRWNAGQYIYRGIHTPQYPFAGAVGKTYWDLISEYYNLLFDNPDYSHIYEFETGGRKEMSSLWFREELILSILFHIYCKRVVNQNKDRMRTGPNEWWWVADKNKLKNKPCRYEKESPILHHYYSGNGENDANHIPPAYWTQRLVNTYKNATKKDSWHSWSNICCSFCGWNHETATLPVLRNTFNGRRPVLLNKG
jgi:hypothetical protein